MDNFVSVGLCEDVAPMNLTSDHGGGGGGGSRQQLITMSAQHQDQPHDTAVSQLSTHQQQNENDEASDEEGDDGVEEVDDDEDDDDEEEEEDDTDEEEEEGGGSTETKGADPAGGAEAEEKEDYYKGKIFHLADSPAYWNVKLYCSDGTLEQNKLTMGLVFPGLKRAEIFSLHPQPELIMAEFTRAEVQFLIQEEFKNMYNKQKEKEAEAAMDLIDEESMEYEQPKPRTTRSSRRGRPKGSTNRKKIKLEPGDWEDGFEDFSEYGADCETKVKDEDSYSPSGKSLKHQKLIFPITFDLKAANEKFNKLLDDVRAKSEKLDADLDKKDRWKCSLCGQVCANLAVHVGRNHAEQDFSCSQCDVRVGSEYLLKLHEKTHMSEARPCNLCGKVVKDMRNHLVQKHQGESKSKIQCSQCSKVYVKNAEYQRHFNSAHLGIKASCPICQKELLPNKITSHVRMVHEKVKNHFCSNCGKGFYDKRDMELHIQRIHLGTKELCIECGKELSAGQLKNHIKKCHSGENFKVICPVCGKKVGYLDEHMRSVHKKEKNHQCPLCPLKCYKRNTLKRHLEWHEKGKLTVNGTPKKPRILKRDKDSQEEHDQEPHHSQSSGPEQPMFPPVSSGFPDPASIMNLAHFYRGHSM